MVPIEAARARRRRTGLAFAASLLASQLSAPAPAATFNVNSIADVVDAAPGDGVCRTAPENTICTLRAAIMESNALAGADVINLQANATYLITRPGLDGTAVSGDLDIFDSVTIVGAGAASTIIDGNRAATDDRVFEIFPCLGNPPQGGDCTPFSVTMSGITVRNGGAPARAGGGISNRATLQLSDCAITGNLGGTGGGVLASGPTTITRCSISGNEANNNGGGLYVDIGTMNLVGSTLSGNQAGFGSALFADTSTLNFVNSTVSGNGSRNSGGGLYLLSTATQLFNTTITNNAANSDDVGVGTGGGVYMENGGTLTLYNSIISGNYHRNEGSDFDSNDDCTGTLTSSGFNIVTTRTNCTVNGAASSAFVTLDTLQDNGGPTRTHALPSGSVAIDAGNPTGCTDQFGAPLGTDQRGEPRPFGTACDLGAFERGSRIFRDGFES